MGGGLAHAHAPHKGDYNRGHSSSQFSGKGPTPVAGGNGHGNGKYSKTKSTKEGGGGEDEDDEGGDQLILGSGVSQATVNKHWKQIDGFR